MTPIKTIYITDIFEIFTPFIDAKQIEIGRTDKIDRSVIAMKKSPYIRNIVEQGYSAFP